MAQNIRYLSEAHIRNVIAPRVVGPEVQLVSPIGLTSAVGRQVANWSGMELFPTIPEKAGALLEGIARNHPFFDGNKRVSVASALVLCRINHYELTATDDQIFELALGAANGNLDTASINNLMSKYTTPPDRGLS